MFSMIVLRMKAYPQHSTGKEGVTISLTIQTHGRYAANHTAVRLDAVQLHLGIGSLPLFTARDALAQGDIVQVLAQWEFISSYSGQLWLLWSGNKHMPARMRAMIDYLSEKIDGHQAAYGARDNTSVTQR